MPYVVKYGDSYLVRPVNGGFGRKRRFTGNVNEATTWSAPGHAKNAIREMFNNPRGLVPASAVLEIVLVNYSLGPVAARVKRKADRYGTMRTQDVV